MNNRIVGSPRRPSWSSRVISPLTGGAFDASQMTSLQGLLKSISPGFTSPGSSQGSPIKTMPFRFPAPGEPQGPMPKNMPFLYPKPGEAQGPAVIPLAAQMSTLRGRPEAMQAGPPMASPLTGAVQGRVSPLTGTPQGVVPDVPNNLRPVPPRPQAPGNSMTPFFGGMAGLPGVMPLDPRDPEAFAMDKLGSRIASIRAGNFPGAQAARDQDTANYQAMLQDARQRLNPVPDITNRMNPLLGAAVGGAGGAGMVERYRPGSPLAQQAMSPGIEMTPDRGLGSVTAQRWGEEPLVFNRQMTDEQAMDKAEQAGRAFTRTNRFGERAYTSRRQAAQDRVASLKASGITGSELDDAISEANRLVAEDAARGQRYAANRAKWRDAHRNPITGDPMNERDWNKMQRKIRSGREWMKENRINPKSPLAQTLYPEVAASATGGSPLSAGRKTASPITAPSGSPRAGEEAAKFVAEQVPTFPVAKALGVTPDWTSLDIVKSLHNSDMKMELSDVANLKQMMQTYQEKAKASGDFDEKDPYGLRGTFSNFNPENAALLEGLFDNLMNLPDDDRSRQQWLTDWSSRRSRWSEGSAAPGQLYTPPSMGSPGSGR